jgi:hypothetical protein
MRLLFTAAICLAASAAADTATADTLRLLNASDKAVTFSLVAGENIGSRRLEPRSWTDIEMEVDADERVLIVRDAGKSADALLATPSRVRETVVFRPEAVASRLLVAFFHQPEESEYGLELFAIGQGSLVPVREEPDAAARLGKLQDKFHAETRRGLKKVEFAPQKL